jgi:hypothetical protein
VVSLSQYLPCLWPCSGSPGSCDSHPWCRDGLPWRGTRTLARGSPTSRRRGETTRCRRTARAASAPPGRFKPHRKPSTRHLHGTANHRSHASDSGCQTGTVPPPLSPETASNRSARQLRVSKADISINLPQTPPMDDLRASRRELGRQLRHHGEASVSHAGARTSAPRPERMPILSRKSSGAGTPGEGLSRRPDLAQSDRRRMPVSSAWPGDIAAMSDGDHTDEPRPSPRPNRDRPLRMSQRIPQHETSSEHGCSLGWKLTWNFQPSLEVPTSAWIYTPGKSR